jgi:hypothetical protein
MKGSRFFEYSVVNGFANIVLSANVPSPLAEGGRVQVGLN